LPSLLETGGLKEKKSNMARLPSITSNIVKEYLGKFPKTPSLTLARKIYNENNEVFSNIEHVRSTIRVYRGKSGSKLREEIKNNQFYNQAPTLPKSEKENKPTYIFPTQCNRILIISDIHCPYHDNEAIEAALNYGVERKANTVLINGDLIDFYGISRFEKDPRKRGVKYEIDCAKQILKYIRHKFPLATIIFYMGNHDHRWTKYMLNKAPELLDIEEFSLYHILGLAELQIHLLDNNRGTKAGKLNIRHGHEFFGSGGVFPARSYFLKAKDNILVSHAHKTSEYTTPDINKKINGGFSIGCLSDLSPDYAPNSEYNLGFAFVKIIDNNGSFIVENKRIIDGKVM
jgi:predicted phosphodiesterase